MGELRPLGDDLTDSSRALAQALRELFEGMGVSVRRYAARRRRDPGTFSRYLNGTRLPPWQVIMDLFADLAQHRGTAVTAEAIEFVRGLYGSAVDAGSSPKHAVEILEQQLADADRVSRRSSVRGDVLGDALLDRTHRIADLEVRLNQLEADRSAERERADKLAAAHPDVSDLLRERDALEAEVSRLGEELREAGEQRAAAEARCDLLERQLEAVERPALPVVDSGPRILPRILIVDDQADNLLAMRAVLETLDQGLVTVSSGREALKALLDHDDFAVIIMDVQMPEMDGYETCAHIKRRPRTRDVPIIFLTAMGVDPEHSARGYAAGAVDYISKPFDPWALRAKVAVFTSIYLERHAAR
ncbi:regulator [Streptomyces eurocidicus]|uniref:CheY-like chemotaxis protein n=1 Tax=Streptomyces eurocidicus TaxID=66423 RepID=A0A2N8NVH6_STREU|nr:response regulator [Streptomyces eurocidicus]MBB5122259.1 CheY-like chemotaxis protein [Streptomyces eurocidicus]MBF6055144.1 response regulator [Streptomyces eurocidicus]PNE32785.1 regulator [Streptomyces eurocidicus]